MADGGSVSTGVPLFAQVLPGEWIPDTKLIVIAASGAFTPGVPISRPHLVFATRVGGWLGVGNDATYDHADCFYKLAVPGCDETARSRVAIPAEALDRHRKERQTRYPALTLTGMYVVLEKLNAERAEEERRGLVRWLRPGTWPKKQPERRWRAASMSCALQRVLQFETVDGPPLPRGTTWSISVRTSEPHTPPDSSFHWHFPPSRRRTSRFTLAGTDAFLFS